MLLGLMLDLLVVVLVAGAQFSFLHPFLVLGLGILGGMLYRLVARAKGRQSFGQAVFHLATVSRQAGPASYGQSARRTFAEVILLPLSLLRGEAALQSLDGLSGSYEVRLV